MADPVIPLLKLAQQQLGRTYSTYGAPDGFCYEVRGVRSRQNGRSYTLLAGTADRYVQTVDPGSIRSAGPTMPAANAAAAPPNVTPATAIFIGDSNELGSQQDPQVLSYTADPLTTVWIPSQWVTYAPNVNPAYSPDAGNAGYNFTNRTGRWGPSARFAQRFRAAFPGRPLRIISLGFPGATAGFYAGQNTYASFDPAQAQLFGYAKTTIAAAKAALPVDGAAPVAMVHLNLGVNDAARSDLTSGLKAIMQTIIGKVRTDLGYVSGSTKIIVDNIDAGQPNAAAAQTALSQLAGGDVTVIPVTGFAKNPGGDAIHFAGAGQIAIGNAVADAFLAA